MNEFDIFIKKIILQCIKNKGTCTYLDQRGQYLVFKIDFENQHHVVSRQQFKILYTITYSIESAIQYQTEILRYLDSQDQRHSFISSIVNALKSEIETFVYSLKPDGQFFIC